MARSIRVSDRLMRRDEIDNAAIIYDAVDFLLSLVEKLTTHARLFDLPFPVLIVSFFAC